MLLLEQTSIGAVVLFQPGEIVDEFQPIRPYLQVVPASGKKMAISIVPTDMSGMYSTLTFTEQLYEDPFVC